MDALVSFPCLIPVQVSGAGATYDGYLNVNVGTSMTVGLVIMLSEPSP